MSNSTQQRPIPQVSLADNTVCICNSDNGVGIPVYSYHPLELLEPISVYDTSVGNTLGLSIIPIFNSDDFREWKRKVLAYLNLAKVAYALTNTMPQTVGTGDTAVAPDLEVVKEWKTSNAQALGLFQLKLSPTLQWIIKDTAKETWDALKAEYDVPSLLEVFTYFQGLIMARTAKGQNPNHSANLIRQYVAKLSENDFPVPSNFQAMFLLNSLPKSYEGVKTQMFVSNKGKDLTFDNILPFIKQEYNRQHMNGVTAYATQISGVQRYTSQSPNWNGQKKFRPRNPNPNSGKNNNQNQNSGNQGNKSKQPVQPQQNQQKSDGKKNNKKKSNKKGKGKKPNGAISVMMAEITDLPQKEEPQIPKQEEPSDDGKVPTKCVNHFCTSPDKTIYGFLITGRNCKAWYVCEQCYRMHSHSFAKQKILQKAVLVCLPINEKAYDFL
ncbi:gag-pol polyprotein [Moniliophthora roreri]|nr:gag-pol polyprotein [Moniliophthora roreri]